MVYESKDSLPSLIGLGCASFGDIFQRKMTQDKCNLVIAEAYNSGISFYDTAPWYGGGLSEERLGKAMKSNNIPRKNVFLSTKVCRYTTEPIFDYSVQRMENSFEKSLHLLNTNYVDLLMVHDVEFSKSPSLIASQVLPKLQQIKDRGEAKNIGISGYDLEFLLNVIEKSQVHIDYVMTYARYTLLDTSLMKYSKRFREYNVKIIACSITAMGLLTESGPPSWHPAPQSIKKICNDMKNYCKSVNTDISSIAYDFVFSNGLNNIDHFMLGTSAVEELESTLKIFKKSIVSKMFGTEIDWIVNKILHGNQVYQWENIEIESYSKSNSK